MILCESITDREYSAALERLRSDNPAAAWGLTFRPRGYKYLFPEHGVYVCLQAMWHSHDIVEVTGCFRLGEGKRGAAQGVVDLCRTRGFSAMVLDCFEPVAPAWYAAGLYCYNRVQFDTSVAPVLWLPEYGTPDVLYLRKDFEE